MTESPAFLFIFLPGSITKQLGPGRSPRRTLREPDLSRPPSRSEHLQAPRPARCPRSLKAQAGTGAGAGGGHSREGGLGRAGAHNRPTPKSFGKPHSAALTAVAPVGRGMEKKRCLQQEAPARLLPARTGSVWFQTKSLGVFVLFLFFFWDNLVPSENGSSHPLPVLAFQELPQASASLGETAQAWSTNYDDYV